MGDISEDFSRSEFACKCTEDCGKDTVDVALLRALEGVRIHFDAEVVIHSGIRCCRHNAAVGGGKDSQHLWGKAADFHVVGISLSRVADYLEGLYSGRYGIGRYDGWIHLDVRDARARWNG